MTQYQFFAIMTAIYIAPNMSRSWRAGIAIFFFVGSLIHLGIEALA